MVSDERIIELIVKESKRLIEDIFAEEEEDMFINEDVKGKAGKLINATGLDNDTLIATLSCLLKKVFSNYSGVRGKRDENQRLINSLESKLSYVTERNKNEVDGLKNKIDELRKENTQLKINAGNIMAELNEFKKNRYSTDNQLRLAKMKNGKGIAYKQSASRESILALKKNGYNNNQIADSLKISRSTVWRRLKEN